MNARTRFATTGAYHAPPVSMRAKPSWTCVVPTYNEARRLPDSLPDLLALAEPSTELVFVDDGSDDATAQLLEAAARGHSNVHVLRHTRNRGKGAALRDGVFAARGDEIVFMDADLATDLEDLASLRRSLERCDIAIGSRALDESVVEARDYRAHMGRVFNHLTRGICGLPYRDTQCGFKGFRAAAAKLLFALSEVNGFAIDVELLLLAQRMSLRVEEIAVHWTHVDGSHVRPLHDAARMTTDIVAARRAPRHEDSVAVVSIVGPPGTGRAVRRHVRRNDAVIRDDDAVHVVLGRLCPVPIRHLLAARLTDVLDRRAEPARVPTSRLIDVVQRRRSLTPAPGPAADQHLGVAS